MTDNPETPSLQQAILRGLACRATCIARIF
jgi:hypothetical protein